MSREERVYLVEADYRLHNGGIWTWRRRYLTSRAAERQAERRRSGWSYDAVNWQDEDVVQEPALAVRVIPSDPITWPARADAGSDRG